MIVCERDLVAAVNAAEELEETARLFIMFKDRFSAWLTQSQAAELERLFPKSYKPFKERTAMFVVTVEFWIHQQHENEFRETVLKQARNSVTLEADCHRFDVSSDAKDGCRVFLYELYTDEAAYQAHRQTPHYHDFSTRIADWVAQKNIKTWHSLYPS